MTLILDGSHGSLCSPVSSVSEICLDRAVWLLKLKWDLVSTLVASALLQIAGVSVWAAVLLVGAADGVVKWAFTGATRSSLHIFGAETEHLLDFVIRHICQVVDANSPSKVFGIVLLMDRKQVCS